MFLRRLMFYEIVYGLVCLFIFGALFDIADEVTRWASARRYYEWQVDLAHRRFNESAAADRLKANVARFFK